MKIEWGKLKKEFLEELERVLKTGEESSWDLYDVMGITLNSGPIFEKYCKAEDKIRQRRIAERIAMANKPRGIEMFLDCVNADSSDEDEEVEVKKSAEESLVQVEEESRDNSI